MLFNSARFIFLFLPVALAGFFIASRWFGRTGGLASLVIAAMVFYAAWRPGDLLILGGSIAANYGFAWLIVGLRDKDPLAARRWLILAMAANLMLLGLFKYFDFVAETVADAFGAQPAKLALSLPLGISFFTFTQITYLVDAARGRAERTSPLRYAVFVTYFPHLIAGPILHHSQILPQFDTAEPFQPDKTALVDGAALFMGGLAKKVMLADPLGAYAAFGFGAAAHGPVTLFAAWGAALSYTFQIYFDFSGYSDMALGLARMMRIELPANFASPYKAVSIAEFWRRWHMTLSRFLREYVYIPLGGNRRGPARLYLSLMATMLLGGLWHGAGWTFIIWGGLHGVFLAVNRAFQRARAGATATRGWAVPAWLLTFLCVVLAWVFFRAADLHAALSMLRGMVGLSGAALPAQITHVSPIMVRWFGEAGSTAGLADGSVLGIVSMIAFLALSLCICLGARNFQEMSRARRIVIAGAVAPFLVHAVLFSAAPSAFIYFRF